MLRLENWRFWNIFLFLKLREWRDQYFVKRPRTKRIIYKWSSPMVRLFIFKIGTLRNFEKKRILNDWQKNKSKLVSRLRRNWESHPSDDGMRRQIAQNWCNTNCHCTHSFFLNFLSKMALHVLKIQLFAIGNNEYKFWNKFT